MFIFNYNLKFESSLKFKFKKNLKSQSKQNLHNACTLAVPLRPISFAAFGITFSASQIGFLAY